MQSHQMKINRSRVGVVFSGLCTPVVEEDVVYVSMHIHFPATAFTDKRDTLYTLMALMARN